MKSNVRTNEALILEGGGMRGVFTAGVLDYFLDKGIEFGYTIGVSAGSGNALNYMAKQKGRTKVLDIDFLQKYDYIGFSKILTKGSIMDFNLLFDRFPNELYPYDYETYFTNPLRCESVATNCLTGEAVYLDEREDRKRLNLVCQASCSLPFVCPITMLDGIPMLDGGIADAIPIERAWNEGYEKCVVVLTRPKGYRKNEPGIRVPKFVYKNYPLLQEKLRLKNKEYNRLMDLIEKKEKEGELTVIRPDDLKGVDRLERNTTKLTCLYEHGYEIAKGIFG